MELKPRTRKRLYLRLYSLNRTFYGIETKAKRGGNKVLNGLNRTFYGIETTKVDHLCTLFCLS